MEQCSDLSVQRTSVAQLKSKLRIHLFPLYNVARNMARYKSLILLYCIFPPTVYVQCSVLVIDELASCG